METIVQGYCVGEFERGFYRLTFDGSLVLNVTVGGAGVSFQMPEKGAGQ